MAQIKINNASKCINCGRYMNCSSSVEYNNFVTAIEKLTQKDNSIKAKVSIKCKKEC